MAAEEDYGRPAVLLNPLEGDPTDADSHIGGPMLWPIDEPWPWCDVDGEPFVGAVQLYQRDFPELPFPEGTDLLQLFLCTLDHDTRGPDVRLVWRDSSSVVELIEEEPQPSRQEELYVPTLNVFEPVRRTPGEGVGRIEDRRLDGVVRVRSAGVLLPGVRFGPAADVVPGDARAVR
jgi:hypothetical protein